MEAYCKFDKPYIYAAFSPKRQDEVLKLLEKVNSDGAEFWYANDFNGKEKLRLKSAFGVVLFVTDDFAGSERFHNIVNAAVSFNQRILCVYLDEIEETPWSIMQLGTQQALYTDSLDDSFASIFKASYIFHDMAVTDAQKSFQKKRAIFLTAVPVLAAIILFVTVINPLLIVPSASANKLAKKWGLSRSDLESITALHIAGNQAFDTSVYAYYKGNKRNQISYDLYTDGYMEEQAAIPLGSLTSEDLSILKYMTNLEVLEIEGQQITDITPLINPNIRVLGLNCNPITSLAGIEQMQNLEELTVSYTDITDISPVFKLEKLSHLQLDYTHVSDINGIEKLKSLNSLMIAGSCIRKLPIFGAVENLTLDLRCVSVPDLSCIADVKSICTIFIDDIPADKVIPYLRGKAISEINWSGVSSLEPLYELNIVDGGRLGIANNTLRSLDGIENFEGIAELDLHHNPNSYNYITDFTPLLRLKSLKKVFIASDMRQMVEAQLKGFGIVIDYADY